MIRSKRDFLKGITGGLLIAATLGAAHAQTPISTGEGIVGGPKPLCRESIAAEARQLEFEMIEEVEKSGIKISSEQKEMLLKKAADDAISILSAQCRFVD